MPEKLFAIIETNHGNIVCELYPKSAPKTVENFAGLAQGTKEWIHPKTHQTEKRPLYDGTIFHRIIPNFMIQGGDPLGLGMGGPGYRFADEIDPSIKFDKAGRLAMANSGPNTNGSQFFITTASTTWLNGKHTIFGSVIEGQAVVEAISNLPRDERDRPIEPVIIKHIQICENLNR